MGDLSNKRNLEIGDVYFPIVAIETQEQVPFDVFRQNFFVKCQNKTLEAKCHRLYNEKISEFNEASRGISWHSKRIKRESEFYVSF